VERIAVVGVGAIGGLLAAELIAAGNDVTLCGRTPLERLVVERDEHPREYAVHVHTDPAEVNPARHALVALKGHDNAAANPWLERLRPEVVVVVQNGVEHAQGIDRAIVPGIINTAVERAPGKLVHRAGGRLTLAPGGEAFTALLDGSAVEVVIEPDFKTAAWRKLLSNFGANPLTAITQRRSDVFREPVVRAFVLDLLAEAIAIGRAEGARLTDADAANTLANYDALPDDVGTSMLYDREAGRPLEIEPLVGAVLRAAERHGLQAPRAETLRALLVAIR
jgi:2-dehydropantoate 2-reductase